MQPVNIFINKKYCASLYFFTLCTEEKQISLLKRVFKADVLIRWSRRKTETKCSLLVQQQILMLLIMFQQDSKSSGEQKFCQRHKQRRSALASSKTGRERNTLSRILGQPCKHKGKKNQHLSGLLLLCGMILSSGLSLCN